MREYIPARWRQNLFVILIVLWIGLGLSVETFADVLWDQPLSVSNHTTYSSQDFEAAYDSYDIYLADDFTNTQTWIITEIFIPGNTWNAGGDLTCANTLNWEIYPDDGGKPAGNPRTGGAIWSLSLPPTDSQVTLTTGTGGWLSNVTLNLSTPINLAPGTYWLVFYPQMDFGSCFQYGRQVSDTTNGWDAVLINPDGGFGLPTTWSSMKDTWGLSEQDLAFRLEGVVSSEPLPDIKANGSDGPVNLQHGDPLSVTIALTPGDMAGQGADWWVIARDPSFRYYFYDSDTGRWVLKCLSCMPIVSYQGGLIEMGPYEVLNTTAGPQMLGINTADLPTGTYTFYFGVDLDMDGRMDMDQMYYDSVEVNITP
jgi:hypothetical protein